MHGRSWLALAFVCARVAAAINRLFFSSSSDGGWPPCLWCCLSCTCISSVYVARVRVCLGCSCPAVCPSSCISETVFDVAIDGGAPLVGEVSRSVSLCLHSQITTSKRVQNSDSERRDCAVHMILHISKCRTTLGSNMGNEGAQRAIER